MLQSINPEIKSIFGRKVVVPCIPNKLSIQQLVSLLCSKMPNTVNKLTGVFRVLNHCQLLKVLKYPCYYSLAKIYTLFKNNKTLSKIT